MTLVLVGVERNIRSVVGANFYGGVIFFGGKVARVEL